MRLTTQWCLILLVGWLLFNILALTSAPTGFSDFGEFGHEKFKADIVTAGMFQSIATICLIAAIVCIAFTVYLNLMDRNTNKTIYGPNFENSSGSNINIGRGIIATGRAVVSGRDSNTTRNKIEEIGRNLDIINNLIKNSDLEEIKRTKARRIIGRLRKDADKYPDNKKTTISRLNELAKIFQGAGDVSSAVKLSINSLLKIFDANT